ncbi:MAG: hypothetical protein KKH70_20690 [Gammaproteobacteria bacterium]|uniref:Uncharacterized protein n=1 Tax=viral metagenome TaxID=1070528 RepID=A0A6M3LBK5_9ZZZZ|nr:hypothetical protein [Gammaproteobacteria bacterium]MBU2685715.1 hypothetical protein [Gammaproteobacteria bacterium]
MEEKKEGKIEVVRVTEFRDGESIFESRGFSRVKVTKDGKARALEIPIKSTGISELVESFVRNAPKPPEKKFLAKPDDEVGKELGLTANKWVFLPDMNDEDYKKRVQDHDQRMGNAILLKGIDVVIKDKDGGIVEDEDKKIEVFKHMGMSTDHFQQVINDIQALTRWSEKETESFLA